ncbi:hypothetical protein Pla108_39930 [Botrimarina colliarenosi]|uniref:Uncharacterized protein n=1 Tax=Botrimarina colliarenosi TaxID=2528001 RepID=A0A5C6A378_9BACT|nr:hypothetical protein Pla108_39930 [Botrimarina colliarenosi]
MPVPRFLTLFPYYSVTLESLILITNWPRKALLTINTLEFG